MSKNSFNRRAKLPFSQVPTYFEAHRIVDVDDTICVLVSYDLKTEADYTNIPFKRLYEGTMTERELSHMLGLAIWNGEGAEQTLRGTIAALQTAKSRAGLPLETPDLRAGALHKAAYHVKGALERAWFSQTYNVSGYEAA